MKKILFVLALMISVSVEAEVLSQIADIQHDWAIANYQLKDKAQKARFESLIKDVDALVEANPQSAEALVWRGIVKSSYAGIKGGLGALRLAKAAKADFEQALRIDDRALNGSAYTSLGTLYFKVPGWPLGFGDKDKAEQLLEKALEMNPDGIDSNYFYGVFLLDQQNYQQAEQYLMKAQQAPARPGRPLADQGRQQEIQQALQQVRYQLRTQKHAGIAD